MRAMAMACGLVGALLVGCGGTVSPGTGSGATGGGGQGGSGTGGTTAQTSTGGGTGMTTTGGTGGAATCCMTKVDCPKQPGDGSPDVECVNGVCKDQPDLSTGKCWSDGDCAFGPCAGAVICPCKGMCDAPDQAGGCPSAPSGCCYLDEAVCTDPSAPRCVGGKCEPKPPSGKCWSDADCPAGKACAGSYACLIGSACGPKSDGCTNGQGTCN